MVSTLFRVLDTLGLEMVLVPRDELPLVEAALAGREAEFPADYDPTQSIWDEILGDLGDEDE